MQLQSRSIAHQLAPVKDYDVVGYQDDGRLWELCRHVAYGSIKLPETARAGQLCEQLGGSVRCARKLYGQGNCVGRFGMPVGALRVGDSCMQKLV